MDESISAAIVRLNEAEALCGIEPFNCASGHDEPFHSDRETTALKALRMMIAILKGKVRSERGANRATSKAKQANSMVLYSVLVRSRQLLVFYFLHIDKKLCIFKGRQLKLHELKTVPG
jgi:hypothetical protein